MLFKFRFSGFLLLSSASSVPLRFRGLGFGFLVAALSRRVLVNWRHGSHFMPELEEKLNRVASESGRPADQVVQELVETYIDHDQWFREEVKKGLAQLDRGDFIEHDEVVDRIERLFHS